MEELKRIIRQALLEDCLGEDVFKSSNGAGHDSHTFKFKSSPDKLSEWVMLGVVNDYLSKLVKTELTK